MVARHNVTGRTGHEDYRITRPDVDHHREGSERYYRDYIAANSNDDASLPPPEQDKRWEPPSRVKKKAAPESGAATVQYIPSQSGRLVL